MSDLNLGPCCVCESEKDVRNLMQLSYKAPAGTVSGWGCFVCNLPTHGAVAALCDDCIEKPDIVTHIKFIMKEGASRQPVPPVGDREPFIHDERLHEVDDAVHDMTGGAPSF